MITFSRFIQIFLLSSFSLAAEMVKEGLYFNPAFAFSYNPLGVMIDTKFSGKTPLFPDKDGILWESTKMELSLQNEWTPADNLVSLSFLIEPVAFFDIQLKSGYFFFFDDLGYGCFRSDTVTSRYDVESQKHGVVSDAHGFWFSLVSSLKLKFGKVVYVNKFGVNAIKIDGEGYYLEVRSYLMHKVFDVNMTDENFLFFTFNRNMMAGFRYKYTTVVKSGVTSKLPCIVALWQPDYKWLRDVWVFGCGGVYAEDPHLRGKPYIGILFGKEFLVLRRNSAE